MIATNKRKPKAVATFRGDTINVVKEISICTTDFCRLPREIRRNTDRRIYVRICFFGEDSEIITMLLEEEDYFEMLMNR